MHFNCPCDLGPNQCFHEAQEPDKTEQLVYIDWQIMVMWLPKVLEIARGLQTLPTSVGPFLAPPKAL